MEKIRRVAIVLWFPYLVPSLVALGVEQWWAHATQVPAGKGFFFGGEVPGYYILGPLAMLLQMVAGIPGSLMVRWAPSRRMAALICLGMAVVPLVWGLLGPGGGRVPWTMEMLLPLLGIVGLFGLGAGVTFYFLHPRVIQKTGEGDGGGSEAIHPSP